MATPATEPSAGITADTPFGPDDDSFHTPRDDNPYWAETTWWSFNVPERKIGCWLHATCHTNRAAVTWRVYLWDPTGTRPNNLAYYRISPDTPMDFADADLRDITFPGGGFSVQALRPLTEYRIGYADAAADFAVRFDFRAVHPPRRYTPGEPPIMFSPHLDQLGHIAGEVVLRGERIPLDCYSVRDRTWGPRGGPAPAGAKPNGRSDFERVRDPHGPRWRQVERQRGRGRIQYIFGHSGPRTGFLSYVRPQDGHASGWSPLNHGWLLKDGRFERLDKSASAMKNFRDPVTGWSSHMDVRLTDVTGRSMDAEGFSVSHACEHGGGSTALMRWEFDGEIGWGEDQDVWHPKHFAEMLDALRAVRDAGPD
ncbi:hypothetical protein BST11_12255 [Mycobacterium alsense]|uniref:DUF7065 domain-containing protein n=1 Tax=Mycobacterium alsense TaxID=324058 RepID=A0AA42BZX5_9MYCO|nr:hypothetical protein [Mycobacterium alsense]MCV7380861.1 hypothetical protein [Mycobacterium alsense]OQZ90518.1 hypothetical protein BST11_12255 [Mycobacterium alsense]